MVKVMAHLFTFLSHYFINFNRNLFLYLTLSLPNLFLLGISWYNLKLEYADH